MYEKTDDDGFLEAAAEMEESNTSYGSKAGAAKLEEYKHLKYTTIGGQKVDGKENQRTGFKVFRMLGNWPKPVEDISDPHSTDSVIINQIKIMGNKDKACTLVIPNRDLVDPSKDHILYRIYDLITTFDWVDREKVYRYKATHSDLFEWATHGCFKNPKVEKCAKGLVPRKLVIQNVIDRQDMEWHRKNQATKILAKSSYMAGTDTKVEVFNPGIPPTGYLSVLKELVRSYKTSWENYDLALKSTGETNTPIAIKNASAFKEKNFLTEIGEELDNVIVVGPLTDEERSWKRVELARMFGVSTYTKIFNRLSGRISQVDQAFGTHFIDEIKTEMAKEKEMQKDQDTNSALEDEDEIPAMNVPEEKEAEVATTPHKEESATISLNEASTQAHRRALTEEAATPKRVVAEKPKINTSLLKGWDNLSAEEKADISETLEGDTGLLAIKFKSTTSLEPCPKCGMGSPLAFTRCPACNAKFEVN
jgi:hypothetical protein